MTTLAEFIVPAEEFVLAETLTIAPDMEIEIKRVAGGESTVTPYFWATGGDFNRFEEALREDDMVLEVLTLEEHEELAQEDQVDERFYRVTWKMEVPNLVAAVSEAKATVLEAISEDTNQWEVKILFPSEEALSEFHDYYIEHDFDIQPRRVYRPGNPEEQAEYEVSEKQQDALEAAYHAGYFAVPREYTLTEIAEQLNISRNALSARLRRGQRNLLANTIMHRDRYADRE
ncbi:helix-turn-helix domain-containing protein [Natrinema gelatinilyticum]|uniref:helix-turn-helix domain-containing protein n=1 Tax=Natrinema gelatinilyticum TaxID=2961571 RepID=UPI0020C39466|nr:helix-turn-helix domain-containing protein [Natrinema gelatinilyticum]